MDYEKLAKAIKLCGSTPKVDQCQECPYWAGGYMSECIPRMTADAATSITDLLARAEAAEAANTQLDGTVSTLMESNKRLAEELKAHSDTELAKAHEALSAEWARQKMRADAAEEKYAALLKEKFGENASTKMMEMVDTVNEMRQKLAEAEARAEKAEKERDAAVKELNEVAEAVDGLSDFIDEQVHPLVSYDIYTALRENADAISVWQYESEWRGQEEE